MVVLVAALSISCPKFSANPLLASAGITGLAIAIGSQALVRDFVAGVFILAGQLALGTLRAAGVTGTVERLTMRTIWLRDDLGQIHVVPAPSAYSLT